MVKYHYYSQRGILMSLDDKIEELNQHINNITKIISKDNIEKIISYVKQIPLMCSLNVKSIEFRRLRSLDEHKLHPKSVGRGEIYNLEITEGIGSELSDNHLVVIIQNKKGNMYSEKVNVLPIEGDGRRFNPNYQKQLKNDDLEYGHLDKNPSRIIITDILTYDKARLKNKIGKVKPEYMSKIIDVALKKQLELK